MQSFNAEIMYVPTGIGLVNNSRLKHVEVAIELHSFKIVMSFRNMTLMISDILRN